MNHKPIHLVQVYYQPSHEKILVGQLLLKKHQLFFEYDQHFLTRKLHLSPFKLPLKAGIIPSEDAIFDGLFGVFNDSMPDGWGRLLLDRALMKRQINPAQLTPLDRLCFVGNHGMGALRYEPILDQTSPITSIDLDEIASEAKAFQENDDDRYVEALLHLGGSSAGARPKICLTQNNTHWIIKFQSSGDPKDIGSIEYAYHLMARAAGLDVPTAKLFPSKTGRGYFGTQRFDKCDDQSIHMHSISGLLSADHRMPSLDYHTILQATMHLCHDINECEKQFRLCVFNVFSHNRDDHSKNFSFLMDQNGAWRMSPAYDLTFSSGPGGEHCSMIMGEGKNPGVKHLLKLASSNDIKPAKAKAIIDEVRSSIDRWPAFAEQAQVSNQSKTLVQKMLSETNKNG